MGVIRTTFLVDEEGEVTGTWYNVRADANVGRPSRRMAAAGEVRVAQLPFRCWREAEMHHAYLGLGFTVDDWEEAYVDRELVLVLTQLAGRLPEGTGVDLRATDTGESWVVPPGTAGPTVVSGSRRRLLAWSVGREVRTGTPPSGPGGR